MFKLNKDIYNLVFTFQKKLSESLKDEFYGLYLYNSVTTEDFNQKSSDIDFIVILNNEIDLKELKLLEELHNNLMEKFYYGSKLEGMYLNYNNIGKLNNEINPYPYFEQKKINFNGYFDINYVTWWMLREHGISINSPLLINELSIISWKNVLSTMEYNLNEYWKNLVKKEELFLKDSWIEFSVVTLSRIIYSIENNAIVSKTKACDYIFEKFQKYQDIIKEALEIRNLKLNSIILNQEEKRKKTLEFINFMIDYGDTLLKNSF